MATAALAASLAAYLAGDSTVLTQAPSLLPLSYRTAQPHPAATSAAAATRQQPTASASSTASSQGRVDAARAMLRSTCVTVLSTDTFAAEVLDREESVGVLVHGRDAASSRLQVHSH